MRAGGDCSPYSRPPLWVAVPEMLHDRVCLALYQPLFTYVYRPPYPQLQSLYKEIRRIAGYPR